MRRAKGEQMTRRRGNLRPKPALRSGTLRNRRRQGPSIASSQAPHTSPHSISLPAVCGLLLLAVIAVFGQTAGHDFVNFDDDDYVYENRHVHGGPDRRGDRLGLHRRVMSRIGIRSPGSR